MKRKILILIMLVLCSSLISQEINFKAQKIQIQKIELNKFTYNLYPKKIKILGNNKCKFKFGTYESLFCDFFNINSKKGIDNFFSNQKEKPVTYINDNYIKKHQLYFDNPKKNYLVLDSKLVIEKTPKNRDIFLKYINYNENFKKPLNSIFYIKEINGKLFVSDLNENFELGLFLISTKSEILDNISSNKLSEKQKKILYSFINENQLDIKSLIKSFFRAMKKNRSDELFKLFYDEKFSVF